MKKLILAVLVTLFVFSQVFAGGDQNHGTTGTGTTTTGSNAQGNASQPRTGR